MNPAFLDSMSWEMAEVYGSITDRILINLARHFPYYKPGQPVPASAFEYQARMLAQMGQVSAETMRIIKNGLDGVDKALQNTLEQAIIDAVSKSEPELIDAVKRGIFKPAGIPVVAPNQTRAFQTYYKQAADKLNLVNTVMLESTQQAYQNTVSDIVSRIMATQTALDVGAGETITGVSSWNQAMTHAIARMKQNGITGFIDHAGHRWSAEAYAAMDIRTTVFNTGRAAVWETNENFGNDLYSVSYHNGARPLCYPYQNKVVSSTDNARTVTDLDGNEIVVIAQSATSYGKPAGLFGINCKHYPNPFIPGVSIIRGEPQDEKTNARVYEESQQQRALERKIREEKRDLLMLKERGAPDDVIKAQRAKIRQTDDDIDAFCEQTGRARRQNREGVYTKREFPAAETYDVAEFERTQKERIDQFFSGGGSQQGFKFFTEDPETGERKPLTPKTPIAKPAQVSPTPETIVRNDQKQIQTTAQPATEKSAIDEQAEEYKIKRNYVEEFVTQPTEQEIIDALAGGDKTEGSCCSVALSYCGQKNGLNVLDFRGGESQRFFASPYTMKEIAELEGINGVVTEYGYDFTHAHQLLKKVEKGKEYLFTAGKHCAIVRRTNSELQYLELQSEAFKGWHRLDDGELSMRFGCSRTRKQPYEVLINVESFKGNEKFKSILELINTAVNEQKKGVGGGIK